MDMLFGKKKQVDMTEQVREWEKSLRSEMRGLDRQVRVIERDEMKVKKSVKAHLKNGEMAEARILAKSLVDSRKAKTRMRTTKTQINSVTLDIKQQARMLRVQKTLQVSTTVMAGMNSMVKLGAFNDVMKNLSREMEKAGLIEEMIDDTLTLGDEDTEAEADEEVMKTLEEVFGGKLPDAGTKDVVEPSVISDTEAEAFIARLTLAS
eukprot:m.9569 g.9569  ORF g.9569 m.9569 type:complete len:207 (-) comp7802_c0_seq1:65-685(-)